MSQDLRLYNSADIWNQEMQLGQKNLLRALIDFWPEGVTSALDVGCGDGKLTRVLSTEKQIEIVGLDSSAEALSRLSLPAVLGSAVNMPFDDEQFDLVFSTDTLEHVLDDSHEQVWAELFRVARNHVLVAVPFREELLDATARCFDCKKTYHVNWHQRSYDFADIHCQAPSGWYVQATVISGEAWPDFLPSEVWLRRMMLEQWSGWDKAVCPHCGATGHDPMPSVQLPALAAAALGQQIYDSLAEHRIWRSHSEIVVIFGRTPKFTAQHLSQPMKTCRPATQVEPVLQRLHQQLVTYPQVARCVKAIDQGVIVQFPIYGDAEGLHIVRKAGTSTPVNISLEDGLGGLCSEFILSPDQVEAYFPFSRRLVPGLYGVLLRTETLDSIASLQIGVGPEVSWLSPGNGQDVCYHLFNNAPSNLYVQITDETWLDESLLDHLEKSHVPLLEDLFTRIETLSAEKQDFLHKDLRYLRQDFDAIHLVVQNLKAEREALLSRAHEADQLAVDVQNLKAEREALLSRAHEADQLAVDVQNLKAERGALQSHVKEAERLAVDVQNLKAEREAFISKINTADMHYTHLQQALEENTSQLRCTQEHLQTLQAELNSSKQALARVQARAEYKVGDLLRRALREKRSHSDKEVV